jgi:hypothetical protein
MKQRRVTTQIACCVHFSHSALFHVSGRVMYYVPSSQRGRNELGEKVIKQK